MRLGLGLSLASKEVEEVEAGGGLAEDSGLDTEGVVGSVELDSSELGGLDVAAELGGGHVLPVLLADPEPGLEAGADAVSVTIVDSTSNKTSEAAVAVSVELDSSSEGRAEPLTIAHLCGHAQLGHELTIGVQRGSEAGSEAQVTVASEQTVAGGHSSDSAETPGCEGVLETLVGVSLGNGGRK